VKKLEKQKIEINQDEFVLNQLLVEDEKLNSVIDYITIVYLAITLTSLQVAIKYREIAKIAITIPIIMAPIVAIIGLIIILTRKN